MSVATAIPPPPVARSQPRAVAHKGRGAHAIESINFRTAPSLCAALCFAAGIFLNHHLDQPPALALLVGCLAATLAKAAARWALRVALMPLFLAWIAAGLFCAEIHPYPDPQTGLLTYASRTPHRLQGEVVRAGPIRMTDSTAPFASHPVEEKSQTLDLRMQSIDELPGLPHAISGGVRLTLYSAGDEAFPNFRCGDTVRILTAIHPPERYNDPGVWDSTAYLLQQGIGASASGKAADAHTMIGQNRPPLSCSLKAIQQAASEKVMGLGSSAPGPRTTSGHRLPAFFRISTEDASMLAAMITGDRTWLQRRTRIGFERTGSFHLLVVSGLHLAIFAGIIFWLASRLHLPPLWGLLLTIVAAFAYALFTGFGQPVQRSFWMVALYLLGRLLWRDRSALNAIGFAALCLLAANPPGLF